MPVRQRPLSPHLQIYRWEIGMSLSILHRFTGVALSVGLIALSAWLVALAGGESAYAQTSHWLGSPLGRVALVGWTFAFCYHLLNGLRHLFWDLGRGFERGARHASGWLAAGGAVVLTALVWVLILRGTP